jgi:O-antigen/teichoic acid export membrane protein
MTLKKNLSKVFSVNIVVMLIGIVSALLIPAFLDIKEYSVLKTYTLYTSYIGMLAFGFIDGVYIKYGGKDESNINSKQFKNEHNFLLVMQTTIMMLFVGVSVFINNNILFYFSLTILPFTLVGFFKLFFQATSNFNSYVWISVSNSLIVFALNIGLVILGINDGYAFIIVNIVSYYLIFIFLEIIHFKKYKSLKSEVNKPELFQNFRVGIFILIGNLSSVFFYATDRWFVKFTLSSEDFAFYSFAISMMGIISVMVNAITTTFYPYLSRGFEEEKIKKLKVYLLLIGTYSSGAYFVFSMVVNIFMNKYIPSLSIIGILFAGYPAIIVINALLINLYKAQKKEKVYFYTVILMLLISIVLNIAAFLIDKSSASIAIATTISFYIWYFYSSKYFNFLKSNLKEICFICIYLIVFYTTSIKLNWLWGSILFFCSIFVITLAFYKKDMKDFVKVIFK